MNLQPIWSVAAAAYGLSAAGLLGLVWVIGRRGQHGRENHVLLGMLSALILYYSCVGVDAFLHAGGWTQSRFTLWSGAGDMLGILFWGLMCQFLAFVVTRVTTPEWVDRQLTVGIPIMMFVLSGFMIFLFAWAAYDIWRVAPPATVQSDLVRLSRAWGNFSTVWILPPAYLLSEVFRRLPKQDRTGWWGTWVGRYAPEVDLVSLDLQEYPSGARLAGPAVSRNEVGGLPAVYATAAVLLGIGILNTFDRWTAPTLIATLVFRVLLLAGVMGLIYNHARFAFFDVVLKRGVCFVALASIAASIGYFGLPYMTPISGGVRAAVFVMAATLFGCLCVWVYHRCDRLLDRLIFRRPDYRNSLQEVTEAMARCGDAESLTQIVVERLPELLHAESANFARRVEQRASAIVPIGAPERVRGYLVLGPRERGQLYRSEDLNFLDAVASQFSAMLESFDARQLQELAVRAELKALRAQINPHFLFNALNTLAEMAKDNPETEKTVLHLARIFRYAVESTRHETVPLRDEIDFIRSYLEIERARFESKLRFEIDAPESLLNTPVPPMLIQPLVENAVKHGISPKIDGGTIHVSVSGSAHRLCIRVDDDGVGFDPQRTTVHVGMENVRLRVEALGGGWKLESAPQHGTAISLELATP